MVVSSFRMFPSSECIPTAYHPGSCFYSHRISDNKLSQSDTQQSCLYHSIPSWNRIYNFDGSGAQAIPRLHMFQDQDDGSAEEELR